MPKKSNAQQGLDQPAGKKAQATRVKGVNKMIGEDANRKSQSKAVKGNPGKTRPGKGQSDFQ